MPIVLRRPTVESNDARTTYRVEIEGWKGCESLWFSVPAEVASLVNPRADAALVALLMPLMSLGQQVSVEGSVTDELLWNIRGDVQQILRRVRPELSPVEIVAADPQPATSPAAGVATGYSAGVDSFTTLARHFFGDDVPVDLRVTHLLYNNVGSHGPGETGRTRFANRLRLIRPKALSTGLPLIEVDSNLDDFYAATCIAFQPSHTMRNAAVAHLLSGGIGRFLYASTFSYDHIATAPTFDIAFADPLLLPVLSTRAVTLQPVGTDIDREAKMALVARLPHAYDVLDVCVATTDGSNCSECRKCQRTMLFLELMGTAERFASVFTTPRDPRWREEHIVQSILQRQDSPSARSVVRLYDERIGVPLRLRVEARRRTAVRLAGRAVRSIRRRVVGASGA